MNRRANRGFALVVTLSLMILLTIIAVGLLTLSAVSLRESNQHGARRVAMSNARLALLVALGDLQQQVGPDTRVTATAAVLGDKAVQSHLTGVWNSRAVDPASPGADGSAAKVTNFRTWLASGDPTQTNLRDYAFAAPTNGQTLVSRELTGNVAGETSATRVLIHDTASAKATGSYAYAVFDEGVKARVNLGHAKPATDLASRTGALGGGQRPGIDRLDGTGTVATDAFSLDEPEGRARIGKVLSLPNADLGYNAPAGSFGRHFHDLTTNSLGLMSNVSAGGFKRDLGLIAEAASLPPELAGESVYKNAFGLTVPSDPTWEQLVTNLNLYRGKNESGKFLSSEQGLPVLRATAPRDWSAGSGVKGGPAFPTNKTPSGPVLLPSIAKIQMIFSLATRDIFRYPKGGNITDPPQGLHYPWCDFFRYPESGGGVDSKYDYLLHLVYTPVVTLHNPYNVAIEFNDLRVEFVDLPFSLQVFRNGKAQSNGLVPFNAMYGGGGASGVSKRFGLNLGGKDGSGAPNATPVRLAPGEVKVFSPYIPASRTWADEIGKPLWFVDWANNNSLDDRLTVDNVDVDTSKIKAVTGWRGDGIGFDLDSFAPGKYNATPFEVEGASKYRRNQCIGLKKDDEIHVEFAPIPDPDRNSTRFTIEMTLVGANPDKNARTSVIEFKYLTQNALRNELIGYNATMRYPETGEIGAMDIFDHSSVAIGSTSNTRPFAMFSAFAKTAHGGFNGSHDDGSYASKPWSMHDNSALTASQNIIREHPAHYALEINLARLPGNTDEVMDLEPGTDRGHFVSGHRVLTGRHLGTIHDIQLGPARNLMALNSARPAASYYLPHFTAPIGNSFAHPLISSDSVLERGAAKYDYADHSFLLNSILFDNYYFSGFQGRDGPFGDGSSARDLAVNFLKGTDNLSDSRFLPHLPDGAVATTVADELLEPDGYRRAAAYQMLQGSFNVNSTSVDAWMAVLSAMSGDGASILNVQNGAQMESLTGIEAATDPKGARFSRFSLPNAQPNAGTAESFWQAPRDLDRDQLKRLATEIVTQVRTRGPFLSMSDFINRQPGAAGEASLSGALQTAIGKSGVNDNSGLGGFEITADDVATQELAYPEAATGPSAQGAPGFLTQADLLAVLGNSATVRSDTFIIRCYGDARDATGNVTARAWCEAVVQRMPEYLDPQDASYTAPADLKSPLNKNFGRRFDIVSFRWLSPQEI